MQRACVPARHVSMLACPFDVFAPARFRTVFMMPDPCAFRLGHLHACMAVRTRAAMSLSPPLAAPCESLPQPPSVAITEPPLTHPR